MGVNLNTTILKHEPVLKEFFKEKMNIDIRKTVESHPPDILYYDTVFTAPYFGYKSLHDYHYKASSYHRIPMIETPTFFFVAADDPIVPIDAIEIDRVKENKHTFIGVSLYGGHLGYKTSVFSTEHWFIEPVLAFFDSFWK